MKNKELKEKFDMYLDNLSQKHHTGELLEKDIYIDEVWDELPGSMKFGVLVDFYASEGLLCFIGYNVGDGTHVGVIYIKGEKEPEWLEKHISEDDAREAIVDVAPQVWEKLINKDEK